MTARCGAGASPGSPHQRRRGPPGRFGFGLNRSSGISRITRSGVRSEHP